MTADIERRLRAVAGCRVVVVGGANTDVVGIANLPLVERDSNPGHVKISPGGVGRNIAENLARLGADVQLVSAFGGDEAGRELWAACEAAGVGLWVSELVSELPGARYLAIAGPDGDMALALSDMRTVEQITPQWLDARRELIGSASLVVFDSNLSVAAIERLADLAEAPLVAEPVSVAKAPRLRTVLHRLTAVTPNVLEAAVLLDGGSTDARAAADGLVGCGVGSAFVTDGANGSGWAGPYGGGVQPAVPVDVASTTGAGDAYAAGVSYAILAGVDAADAARMGAACAAIALASDDTVSDSMSLEAVIVAMSEE